MNLLERFERVLEEEKLVERGDRIVVGISGGPDSTALFHLFHRLAEKWDLHLIGAHVDHRFRGEESRLEAEAVEAFVGQLGWPLERTEIDMPAHIARTKENAQAAARRERYAYFREVARRRGAGKIALAHHADDQAETMLMRVIAGTAATGLAGIPRRRPEKETELIRPLLGERKEALVRYCREQALSFAEDSSNLKTDYVRNRIRLEVMPYLERLNPKLSDALNRLADITAAENDFLDSRTREIFREQVRCDGESCEFKRNSFLLLHVALQRRLITLILRYLCPDDAVCDYAKVESIRSAVRKESPPSSMLDIGGGVRFMREYDRIRLLKPDGRSRVATDYEYVIAEVPAELLVPEAGCRITVQLREGARDEGTSFRGHTLMLDYDRLEMPLIVRNRRNGDRMRIKGLNGSKKVKDIFIDEKMPPSLRRNIPLLADGKGNILWIPGIRPSGLAGVNETTRRILHITVDPNIL